LILQVISRRITMCRSIQQLRQPGELVSEAEIQAAALQFVRKVSGYRKPSRKNQEVFNQAVEAIALATREMLEGLELVSHQTTSTGDKVHAPGESASN
jgi:hypothetical protein